MSYRKALQDNKLMAVNRILNRVSYRKILKDITLDLLTVLQDFLTFGPVQAGIAQD